MSRHSFPVGFIIHVVLARYSAVCQRLAIAGYVQGLEEELVVQCIDYEPAATVWSFLFIRLLFSGPPECFSISSPERQQEASE
jgi:hypothetical protein